MAALLKTDYYILFTFNSLPNNKITDWSKMKALADDKIKVTKKLKFKTMVNTREKDKRNF